MPDVTLCECFARDGLQHEPGFIATAAKRALIERFAGIGFARLSAKLVQTEQRIEIVEALAGGGSIGITARGWVERKTDVAEIEGTAVPAYTLNRVIGAIPLLGTIITGGQNEGVVAADFRITGPLERPEVSVNPLSALAPGILRRIVRFFGGLEGEDDRPEDAKQGPNR